MARRKTLTTGSKHAIATAQCKKMGHSSFKKGGKGAACRKKIAEGIAKRSKIVPGPARKAKS